MRTLGGRQIALGGQSGVVLRRGSIVVLDAAEDRKGHELAEPWGRLHQFRMWLWNPMDGLGWSCPRGWPDRSAFSPMRAADSAGGMLDTEFGKELSGDPVFAPLEMIPRDAPDEADVFAWDAGPTDSAGVRLEALQGHSLKQLKTRAIPASNDIQCGIHMSKLNLYTHQQQFEPIKRYRPVLDCFSATIPAHEWYN